MGGSESNSMTYFYQVLTFISPARSFQKRFQNPVEHEAVIEMYGNQQSTELPLLFETVRESDIWRSFKSGFHNLFLSG